MKRLVTLAAACVAACSQPDFVEPGELATVAKTGQYADLEGAPDLAPYAQKEELSVVARTGSFSDLVNAPNVDSFASQDALDELEASFAAVATSGSYTDLTGAPELALVALSGSYEDLVGRPEFAPVATSGAYADLSGSPVLAPVATSGAYADLDGRPVLAPIATSGAYADLAGRPDLAPVATSGTWQDLTNAPWTLNAAGLSTPHSMVIGDTSAANPLGVVVDNVAGLVDLDQDDGDYEYAVWNVGTFWQSFQPVRTGELAALSFGIRSDGPTTGYTIRVREGRGTSGATLYEATNVAVTNSAGKVTHTLTSAVTLTADQEYTFEVSNTSNFLVFMWPWSSYTRGTSSQQGPGYPNVIASFETYMKATRIAALSVTATGRVGLGTAHPTTGLDVANGSLRLREPRSPIATAECAKGELAWDESYVYVCVAPNTWKRSELASY